MIAHVIDDLFDHYFISSLEEELLDNVGFFTTNIANKKSFPNGRRGGSHRLMGTDIFVREGLNHVTSLHENAEPFFEMWNIIEEQVFNAPVYLRRIDVNLQFYGQHGTPHTDGGSDEITVMVFNNSVWKPEWGGQFQILSDDLQTVLEEHEYIPGRILIFPGDKPHRGLAPLDPYVYRYSTVFRTIIEDDLEDYFDQEYQNRKQCKV